MHFPCYVTNLEFDFLATSTYNVLNKLALLSQYVTAVVFIDLTAEFSGQHSLHSMEETVDMALRHWSNKHSPVTSVSCSICLSTETFKFFRIPDISRNSREHPIWFGVYITCRTLACQFQDSQSRNSAAYSMFLIWSG